MFSLFVSFIVKSPPSWNLSNHFFGNSFASSICQRIIFLKLVQSCSLFYYFFFFYLGLVGIKKHRLFVHSFHISTKDFESSSKVKQICSKLIWSHSQNHLRHFYSYFSNPSAHFKNHCSQNNLCQAPNIFIVLLQIYPTLLAL